MTDKGGETFEGTCSVIDEDSPKAEDCNKAADRLPAGDCKQSLKDTGCFTLENYETCEIQICGQSGFKTDCESVSVMVYNIAVNQTEGCTPNEGTNKGLTSGLYEHEDDVDNYIILENGGTVKGK